MVITGDHGWKYCICNTMNAADPTGGCVGNREQMSHCQSQLSLIVLLERYTVNARRVSVSSCARAETTTPTHYMQGQWLAGYLEVAI